VPGKRGRDIKNSGDQEKNIFGEEHLIEKTQILFSETEDRFQKFFRISPTPCVIIRTEDRMIMTVNPAFTKSYGYHLNKVFGKTMQEINFWTTESKKKLIEEFQNKGIIKETEISLLTINGEERTALISIESFKLSEEKYDMIIFLDTTELKSIEKKIFNAIIKAEEKERSRISHELHDGLGPIISIIKLYLQWMKSPDTKTSKEQIIAFTEKTVEEALTTLKEISHQLSPHILIEFGLISALKSFVDRITETSAISVEIKHNFNERIEQIIEITLYRILAECINNTLKYAKADNVIISLQKTGDTLKIIYSDDGIGFNPVEVMKEKNGIGLHSMRNRTKIIGGNITIKSAMNKGVKITLKIPL
jgi:PAS domain S-box-containing protein